MGLWVRGVPWDNKSHTLHANTGSLPRMFPQEVQYTWAIPPLSSFQLLGSDTNNLGGGHEFLSLISSGLNLTNSVVMVEPCSNLYKVDAAKGGVEGREDGVLGKQHVL